MKTNLIEAETDYMKYRGKCKEMSGALILEHPNLRLVRGHYWCPISNRNEPHWWCVDKRGNVYDPTKKQFLSKGMGDYIEFDGVCECSQCGKKGQENEFHFESNYQFCSTPCHMKFVGL